jgi:hypothetical protein
VGCGGEEPHHGGGGKSTRRRKYFSMIQETQHKSYCNSHLYMLHIGNYDGPGWASVPFM